MLDFADMMFLGSIKLIGTTRTNINLSLHNASFKNIINFIGGYGN